MTSGIGLAESSRQKSPGPLPRTVPKRAAPASKAASKKLRNLWKALAEEKQKVNWVFFDNRAGPRGWTKKLHRECVTRTAFELACALQEALAHHSAYLAGARPLDRPYPESASGPEKFCETTVAISTGLNKDLWSVQQVQEALYRVMKKLLSGRLT